MAENYIAKALKYAEKKHEGQFRNDGKPYFTHVVAVARHVDEEWFHLIPYEAQNNWNKHKDHVIAAAILHDLGEDCGVTSEDLLNEGFSVMTVEIVDILTKRKGETYFDFIMRIHDCGPLRVGAVAAKLSDIWHNSTDNPKEGSRLDKYRLAEYILRYFNRK